MQDQSEIIDKLISSNHAIDIRYPGLFLIFFRPLMEKYLTNPNNQIYISSSNKFATTYVSVMHYTSNPCIHYVNNFRLVLHFVYYIYFLKLYRFSIF